MIEILIVDDHEVVGEGTKNLLEREKDFSVDFMKCSTQVAQHIKEKTYDIFIIDLNMPNKNGLELTTEILKVHQDAKVLIFTGHNIFPHFNYLMDSGVSGFISKLASKKQLIRAIWCAVEGEAVIPFDLLRQLRRTEYEVIMDNGGKISLSKTEEEILVKVSMGKTNNEIAAELYMSRRNVERYLTKVYQKLNVSSRNEAIVLAWELELISEVVI